MKPDRRFVFRGDSSHHDVLAQRLRGLEKTGHQAAADTVAPIALSNVDRALDGVPVTGPLRRVSEVAETAPSEDLARRHSNQDGVVERPLSTQPIRSLGDCVGRLGPFDVVVESKTFLRSTMAGRSASAASRTVASPMPKNGSEGDAA